MPKNVEMDKDGEGERERERDGAAFGKPTMKFHSKINCVKYVIFAI